MIWSAIWRTVILYLFILVILRLMGKREIDQLAPIDLIVMIMIAELAAIPIEDHKLPLIAGIVPILVLAVLEMGLAFVCLWSVRWRSWIYGNPSIVVRDGKIIERELRKIRWNLDDLLQQLRLAGYPNILDVELALVETNGKLSVLPKSQSRPVKTADLQLDTSYEGLQLALVKDGKVDLEALSVAHLDTAWLKEQLAAHGIDDVKKCFLAALTTEGQLYVQARSGARGLWGYLPGR